MSDSWWKGNMGPRKKRTAILSVPPSDLQRGSRACTMGRSDARRGRYTVPMLIDVESCRAYAYTGGKRFDPKLPTVVFIHGAQHDHSVWILQSRYLAHHGFGVLAVDLPGHGRSAGPALTGVEAMADWLVAFLGAASVMKASLVGHSMGSLIAIEAAARNPDCIAKIALVGTAVPMRVGDELLTATRDDEPAAI